MKSRGLEIISKGGSRIVRVDYGNAPYLGIWAKPGAPFVCIEPWFGINDAPEVSGNISEKREYWRSKPAPNLNTPTKSRWREKSKIINRRVAYAARRFRFGREV